MFENWRSDGYKLSVILADRFGMNFQWERLAIFVPPPLCHAKMNFLLGPSCIVSQKCETSLRDLCDVIYEQPLARVFLTFTNISNSKIFLLNPWAEIWIGVFDNSRPAVIWTQISWNKSGNATIVLHSIFLLNYLFWS